MLIFNKISNKNCAQFLKTFLMLETKYTYVTIKHEIYKEKRDEMKAVKFLKKNVFTLVLACAVAVSGISIMPATSVTAATASVPTSLTFQQNSDSSCTIRWNAVSGATYNVYKAKSRYATYESVKKSVTETSFTDDSYNGEYYKVTAVVNGSESELSTATSYEIQTFGYNTNIFEPTDNTNEIQSYIDMVFKTTEAGQFGSDRYAFMFAPGTYSNNLTVKIGFYTQVAGLGLSPEDTTLGNIRCQAEWMKGIRYDGEVNYSALCNFWRSVENLTTTANSTMWAVSQATSMRRMNIKGNLFLHQNGGYASGGFLADTKIAGSVSGGSQQQWLTRNSEVGRLFEGVVWNNVFVGCGEKVKGAEADWPNGANTTVAKTPEIIEKPFLTMDENGNYGVFVPEIRKNAEGVSWDSENIAGEFVGLDKFYVAKPTDSAATINAAIAGGKNLILTPGIYNINEPIRITNENTIVLGLGYATLKPTNGNQCMTVGDVGGVKIAGVLFDAGRTNSPALLTVGTAGSKTSHSENPIALCDTFYRVGGADTTPCKVAVCAIINSNDVIGDNFWVWRADHGDGVGWDKNTADNGIIINGDNVITYGLMVEHFQKYQTLWNGNNGQCYMYQSELPYDIPNQSAWNAPGSYGYTDYKVASNVTSHKGYGIGVYSCYQAGTCYLKSAVECPDTPGVEFKNVCTYSLSGNGGIDYAINTSGYSVLLSSEICKVMSYCNGKAVQDKSYDAAKKYVWLATIKASKEKAVYTGKAIKPSVSVKYKGIQLRENVDYKVTYKNNKKVGKATISITGINGFKDSTEINFNIVPKKVTIKSKKATKKKITIKFKKVKGAKNYQVVYSNKKNFKKKTAITTKGKTQVTIKRKKKGKYYVKIRAFKKTGGKKYYGKYSKVLKFK